MKALQLYSALFFTALVRSWLCEQTAGRGLLPGDIMLAKKIFLKPLESVSRHGDWAVVWQEKPSGHHRPSEGPR